MVLAEKIGFPFKFLEWFVIDENATIAVHI